MSNTVWKNLTLLASGACSKRRGDAPHSKALHAKPVGVLLPLVCLLGFMALTARAESPFFALRVPDSIAVPDTANRDYRLLIPPHHGAEKMPLVIYLHGAGSKGSDNAKPQTEVLPRLLATPAMLEKFPCFILLRQCCEGEDPEGRPNNWVKWANQKATPPAQWETSDTKPSDQLRAAMAALDHVLATQPIDRARLYLTGVSMGGSGTWNWAAREPARFAAAITACGLSEPGKASAPARLPLWCLHGSDDPIAPVARSRRMAEALRATGSAVQFIEFAGAGHNIAERVFTENRHAALAWLFQQKNSAP